MIKPWSISTTVRNPDRLKDFLKVLVELEGEVFNEENQINYQILLIKNKLYKPMQLTSSQRSFFDNIEVDMPLSVARSIFEAQDYEDPAMRGRNSAAPLNKMGLAIAKNSANQVVITPFGRYFLSEDCDLGKAFFLHFLKWELPNPISPDFSASDGFAIKPFVGTLHLIYQANSLWTEMGNNPIGINKEEFSLFAPTLIDFSTIESQANKLIEFRTGLREQGSDDAKRRYRERFKREFGADFLETSSLRSINRLLGNLKDYGDNAIRYFRLTRYICIRGGGFYIDLEPRRSIETAKLLETDDASPRGFETADEYIGFLADINQPVLPWQTEAELRRIASRLRTDVDSLISDLTNRLVSIPSFRFRSIATLNMRGLNQYSEDMRSYRTRLQELELHAESQEIVNIEEYIEALRNIHTSREKKSIELERLATLALNSLNDALAIKPNYPVGDDNRPTFHAPANKPDIECFYSEFDSVCEVTMLTTRSQWYNEGQPVMRHLRDFENARVGRRVYCLFIAPRLHRDTIETFWVATTHNYRGSRQRIIPLSITQFISLLEALLEVRRQGQSFKHEDLLKLYDDIISLTERVENSDDWVDGIPQIIIDWRSAMLAGD